MVKLPTQRGVVSIPGQGTKIPPAVQCSVVDKIFFKNERKIFTKQKSRAAYYMCVCVSCSIVTGSLQTHGW